LADQIRSTVRALKNGTGAKIIIVGPPPQWKKSPRYMAYTSSSGVPSLGTDPLAGSRLVPAELYDSTDKLLHELSVQEGVIYVSAIDNLCEQGRCISRVGDSPTDWIATDEVHLSKAGSEFFVARALSRIIVASK
jgi:hypothetical protein